VKGRRSTSTRRPAAISGANSFPGVTLPETRRGQAGIDGARVQATTRRLATAARQLDRHRADHLVQRCLRSAVGVPAGRAVVADATDARGQRGDHAPALVREQWREMLDHPAPVRWCSRRARARGVRRRVSPQRLLRLQVSVVEDAGRAHHPAGRAHDTGCGGCGDGGSVEQVDRRQSSPSGRRSGPASRQGR